MKGCSRHSDTFDGIKEAGSRLAWLSPHGGLQEGDKSDNPLLLLLVFLWTYLNTTYSPSSDMPITLSSPHHVAPPSMNDITSFQSPSQLSSDGGHSSSSTLKSPSPMDSYAIYSPVSPITKSFTFASEKYNQTPEVSIDVARRAVPGSSHADTQHHRMKEALFPKGVTTRVANEPLHEEPSDFEDVTTDMEEQTEQKELIDADSAKEQIAGDKVTHNARIIAVDFDDVCSHYIPTLVAEHNAKFGTNLTP